jgi:hypothetical protein
MNALWKKAYSNREVKSIMVDHVPFSLWSSISGLEQTSWS